MQLEETVADLAPQLLRYCLARTSSPSLAEDIAQERTELEERLANVRRALSHLSSRERNAISGESDLQPMAGLN